MNTEIERRRHPRIPIDWPFIIETSYEPISGTVRNISTKGAFISLLDPVEIEEKFTIIIQPHSYHDISVGCKKVWSGFKSEDNTEYNAVGTHFLNIPHFDEEFLTLIVAEYFENKTATAKLFLLSLPGALSFIKSLFSPRTRHFTRSPGHVAPKGSRKNKFIDGELV